MQYSQALITEGGPNVKILLHCKRGNRASAVGSAWQLMNLASASPLSEEGSRRNHAPREEEKQVTADWPSPSLQAAEQQAAMQCNVSDNGYA